MPATMAEVLNRDKQNRIAQLTDFPNPEDFVLHVSARIFGYLAETAGPIMSHFQSDLYHDAMSIRKRIEDWDCESDIKWIWSVDKSGTDFREANCTLSQVREHCFLCTVSIVGKSYGEQITFSMERINP